MTIESREKIRHLVFTNRQVRILQMIIDGISLKEFLEREAIARVSYGLDRLKLAEMAGKNSRTAGTCLAIVEAIRRGRLDTANLPGDPQEPLDLQESQFLAAMFSGRSREEFCQDNRLSKPQLRHIENSVCDKLGVDNLYIAVAWLAREKKNYEGL